MADYNFSIYCRCMPFPTKSGEHLVIMPGEDCNGKRMAFVNSSEVTPLGKDCGRIQARVVSFTDKYLFLSINDLSADFSGEIFQIPLEALAQG